MLGAGAGGLGAAVWLKKNLEDFMVVEGMDKLPLSLHNGVHYLHSVPNLPFDSELKKITLTDGILHDSKICHESNLEYALMYSEKVREIQHPSSIMNIGKHDHVYMPKSNTVNEMMEQMYEFAGKDNFQFRYWLKRVDTFLKKAIFEKNGMEHTVYYENLISTIPLDKIIRMGLESKVAEGLALGCAPVYISNYKVEKIVPNWMINLYVPSPQTPIYRASILNGICSVESMRELSEHETHIARDLLDMFHISEDPCEKFTWNTGKVISINQDERERLVEDLKKRDVYFIGRFALWNRKLLVDSTINQAKMVVEHLCGLDWSVAREILIK